MMRILAIGDTHAPYHHPGALDFLSDLRRKHEPEVVVHIGDLGDQHGWSRKHGRSPNALGQKEELDAARAFCADLYKLFPAVKACIGNHDLRLARMADAAGIPADLVASIPEIYESPEGWDWQLYHQIDGCTFIHGDGSFGPDPAKTVALHLGTSAVIGHFHMNSGGGWINTHFGRRFAFHTGCLINDKHAAFDYAASKIRRPALGSAVILDGVPQFCCMG